MEKERITLDVLLKKGEYPVVTDLVQLGQDINNSIHFLNKLKNRIDIAVVEHTGLKIERRNGDRRNNETTIS